MRDKEHERGARDGETENGGLLNVDLCAFPVYGRYCAGGTRDTIGFGLRIRARIRN